MKGMSGAPVRRKADDVVVGIVSGRYNSADDWLRNSVWVARTEDLQAMLKDIAPLDLLPPRRGATDLGVLGPTPASFGRGRRLLSQVAQ